MKERRKAREIREGRRNERKRNIVIKRGTERNTERQRGGKRKKEVTEHLIAHPN